MNNDLPLVSIRCLTYNHAQYIQQCLEGFVMQNTNFKFETIIHDDASTDDTADIIREYAAKYPDIIKPIYETENQYSKQDGSLKRIMDSHMRGKYIAICEGDDYWIDPYKLQKQVDFLEANPEYVLSHTSFKYYYQSQQKFLFSKDVFINPKFEPLRPEDILLGYRIQTCTTVFRKDMIHMARQSDEFLFNGYFLMGDTPLWFELSKLGKIHFLKDVTSVYRKNQNSVTRSIIPEKNYRFTLSSEELRYYLSLHNDFSEQNKIIIKQSYIKALKNYLAYNKSFTPIFSVDFSTSITTKLFDLFNIRRFFLSLKLIIGNKIGVIYRHFKKYY